MICGSAFVVELSGILSNYPAWQNNIENSNIDVYMCENLKAGCTIIPHTRWMYAVEIFFFFSYIKIQSILF